MARILVIDDDAGVRDTLSRALEHGGRHQVTVAADGREALRLAEREPFDLVITDINMPEMDGIEVMMTLSQQQPGLPVIAISGGGRLPKELLLSSASLLGAVTSLPKPFGIQDLRDAVEAALASRASGGDSTG